MAKERLVKNNVAKIITVTNSVFETLTPIEENLIEKYSKMGYELQIVDDKKRKVASTNLINAKALDNFFVKGSKELEKVENADDCIALYKLLKEKNFQTAKGFYIELMKIVENDKTKRHNTTIEAYNYYMGLVCA